MTYIKNTWKDQEVERPRTYQMTNNADGSVTLIDDFGIVTELGTPVNADYMNHIEDGIEDHETRITSLEGKKTDLDLINQSKAMKTGNVSSDVDVYPYILEYAHSTFDKSKFSITGSPTISDNGIASGFSASNFVKVTLNIPKVTSSFLIKGKATAGTLGSKPQQLFLLNNNCRAELSSNGSELIFFSGDFTSNVNLAIRFKTPLKQSDVFEYTFSLDNSTGKIKADALVNSTDNYNTSKDFTLNPDTTAITLMNVSPVGYPWAGSIDLKKIVIFADGKGYFNGNINGKDTIDGIEIPYVWTKSGSKVAGANLRDKIQQVYEKTGKAMYYTIDEINKNFTLPMGEIYGMISNATEYITQVNKNIFSGQGLTSKQYFTLDFLPNDGGIYEVYFSATFGCSTDGLSSLDGGSDIQFDTAVCATNNKFTASGNILIITNNRRVYFYNKTYTGGISGQNISCVWYRKVSVK